MKKKALGIIMALVLVIGSSIPALAATVYIKEMPFIGIMGGNSL